MYTIKMDMLSFGITRRCNQTCVHCCKGKSQNIDLSKEMINCLFDSEQYQIKEIHNFAITGGEPTLVPKVVQYLIHKIIKKKIIITGHVNIFTNGLVYSEVFIQSIYKLIDYLKSNEESKNASIYFRISQDQFHKEIPPSVLEKYSEVPFISEYKPYILEQNQIQNDGNAKENHLGGTWSKEKVPSINYISKEGNSIYIKNAIVVCANGNICSERYGCASFEEEDKYSYGNILTTSFLDIINQFEKM